MKSLSVYGDVFTGAEAETLTATVYQNDSSTTMTCSIATTSTAGNTNSCTDTTHTFTVAAGDRLSIRMVENVSDGGSHANTIGYSTVLVCQ